MEHDLPPYLKYLNEKIRHTKSGKVRMVDNSSFVFTDAPSEESLARFISYHMRHVKRGLIIHGETHYQLEVLTRAVVRFTPWQFSWQAQSFETQKFEARIACVRAWIDKGKYDMRE